MDKNSKQNILIVGSGGREHALSWKLSQSEKAGKIFIAPGNGGTASLGENISIPADDFSALADFAKSNVSLTIVGPDDPLALGIVDYFKEKGLRIWGPSKKAAQIEASKVFAKELMSEEGIPTAEFKVFSSYDEALSYVSSQKFPLVIKASGLALGKGVFIAENFPEAEKALKDIMVLKIFGEAGREVVIEEFLSGQEISIHAFCDGETAKIFPPAQDHKPIFENDKGPNTGGMGTIAPVPWVKDKLMEEIEKKVVSPALSGLSKKGASFVGCLYPGLKITTEGPKVLEFNARFGDPETQSYMRLLETDLLSIINASLDGALKNLEIKWRKQYACCVVLASGGYPGKYEKGIPIEGIEDAEKISEIVVFHAGTTLKDGKYFTSGGRVLGVTAVSDSLKNALEKAYEAVEKIKFKGMQFRRDIGKKSLN